MADNEITSEQKTVSAAAYILPIGWVVAYTIISIFGLKTTFSRFHLKQGLGLNLMFMLFWLLFHLFHVWILVQTTMVVYVLILIYAIAGVQGGKRLYLPFVGKFFSSIFTFIA